MEPEVDDSVCPVCDGSTYVGETISCEVCCRWFHFSCVGVDHGDACVQSEVSREILLLLTVAKRQKLIDLSISRYVFSSVTGLRLDTV